MSNQQESEELKITSLINRGEIPEHIIHDLRDDIDRVDALKFMLKHDQGSFEDLFVNGSDFNEIFECFIGTSPEFRKEYDDELFELMEAAINER